MSENQWHFLAILVVAEALGWHYRKRSDAYVVGNLLIYYEEGNPTKAIGPDIFVAFGASKRVRMNYKLWEEPTPAFVLEIASRSTWRRDHGVKRDLYERLGFAEYWQFDPKGGILSPRLQGLRLERGVYRPVPTVTRGGQPMLSSKALNLDLRAESYRVRFRDPATGTDLPIREEVEAARERAEARAAQAEARVRELQARLEGRNDPP